MYPSRPPTPITAAALVNSPEGFDRTPLLAPVLSTESLTLLYGPRGVGKSFLALAMAWSVAAGNHFLKWQAPQPRRVLYLDGELANIDLRERLAALGNPPANLHFLSRSSFDGTLPRIDIEHGPRLWEPRVDAGYPHLLVIDSLSSVLGEREAIAYWPAVRRWLLRMREMGIAVLLVHHATRRGDLRGPSHREDVFDTVLSLHRPRGYAQREGLRVEVTFEKARGLVGADLDPFEARMTIDGARAHWQWRHPGSADLQRAVALFRQGVKAGDAARQLGFSRSKTYRLLEEATSKGLIQQDADGWTSR
jgi:putative DNA primase/helicase